MDVTRDVAIAVAPGELAESIPFDLIGRADTINGLAERLRSARMVTITGPGGIGKTRVAEVLATGSGPLVDLSAITGHELIPSEIARVLDLRLDPASQPLEGLIAALEGSDRVLVLDNLEQVDRPAAVIEPLLAGVPTLRILATSRVPLHVRGEAEVPIGPLAVPLADDPASVEASNAGAVFLQRARAIGELPILDLASARDVAAICRAAGGIPLGLELAARRLRILPVSDIARRLQRGDSEILRDLDRPERHRSLDTVIDWSLSLLTTEQSRVLSAAAVCPRGFDLDVVTDMLGPDERDGAMDALDALLTSGLVHRLVGVSPPRFDLLEPVRTAVRRRTAEDERSELAQRHVQAMAAIVRRHGWQFENADAFDFGPVAREREGIRAALVAARDDADPGVSLELAARLGGYWYQVAAIAEALDWLDASLARGGPHVFRVHALATRIYLTLDWNDRIEREAEELFDLAFASAEPVAAVRGMVYAAYPRVERRTAEAREYLIPARDRALAAGLERWTVRIDSALGIDAMSRGELDEARNALTAAASTARRVADPATESQVLTNLAMVLLALNDMKGGAEAAGRAVELLSDDARPAGRLYALCILALTHSEAGDVEGASRAVEQALQLAQEHEAPWMLAITLDSATVVLAAKASDLLSLRAHGAAERLRAELEMELNPSEQRILDTAVKRATGRIGAVRAGLATREGSAEPIDELVRNILEGFRDASRSGAAQTEARVRHGNFTRREVEILGLLAQGRSDSEIAETLIISPKTASVHVANVKAKLGVETRLEAALAARELGFGV